MDILEVTPGGTNEIQPLQLKDIKMQANPHLQRNTQTHLDIRHSTLWYNIQFNIEILERFQSKILRLIVDAPWYASNSVIRNDLQVPTIKEEISRFSFHYNVRISVHPNELIASFTEPPIQRHLRRYWPHDLLIRFYQLVLIVFLLCKF
jgi:UV DNA damage repair endonuclease